MVQMELEDYFPALKTLFETRVFTNSEKKAPIAILEYYEATKASFSNNLHLWEPIIKAKFEQKRREGRIYYEATLEFPLIFPGTPQQAAYPKHLSVAFLMTDVSLYGYLRGTGERHVPEVRPRIEILLTDQISRQGICFVLRYPDPAYWTFLMKETRNRVLAQKVPFLEWKGRETD
jgi:hypothetical protein